MNKNTKAGHPALAPINDTALARESWKVFQIMAEFVEGFERLAAIRPSVSIFGSARFAAEHRYSKLAEEIGHALSEAGFKKDRIKGAEALRLMRRDLVTAKVTTLLCPH